MEAALRATLTQTRHREPLAVIDGLPGGGAEMTPAQLRGLAKALSDIATDLEGRPVARKHTLAECREYRLTD